MHPGCMTDPVLDFLPTTTTSPPTVPLDVVDEYVNGILKTRTNPNWGLRVRLECYLKTTCMD